MKNVRSKKSVNVVTAEVTPEANERLTVENWLAPFWTKSLIVSILPMRLSINICVRFSSVIKAVILGMSICLRMRTSALNGSASRIGKPAWACCSIVVTDRTMYDLESSANPTKTGIIETIKSDTIKKTVKNVMRIPRTSGHFQRRSFTTNGQSSKAKKHDIKKRPIKSRSKYRTQSKKHAATIIAIYVINCRVDEERRDFIEIVYPK